MADQNSPQHKRTSSGISIDPLSGDFGLTSTVTLSRKGMGIGPRSRDNAPLPTPPPPKAVMNMIYSVATDDVVDCPRCEAEFEVTPQFYHAIAECPECSTTFVIKPPGTEPYQGPVDEASQPPPPPMPTAAAVSQSKPGLPTAKPAPMNRRQPGTSSVNTPRPQRPAEPAAFARAGEDSTISQAPQRPPRSMEDSGIGPRPQRPARQESQEQHRPPPPPPPSAHGRPGQRPAAPPPPPPPSNRPAPPPQAPERLPDPVPEPIAAPSYPHDLPAGRPAATPAPSAPPPPPPARNRPAPPRRASPGPRETSQQEEEALPPPPAPRPVAQRPAAQRPAAPRPPAQRPSASTPGMQRPSASTPGMQRHTSSGIDVSAGAGPPSGDMMSTVEFSREDDSFAAKLKQGIQGGGEPVRPAPARGAERPADPRLAARPPRPQRQRRPQGAPRGQQQRQPEPQAYEPPPQQPRPRTTSSGIAVDNSPADQNNDMMSTIEIQRTDDAANDKLRQGIREANRAGGQRRDSGIDTQGGSQQPADYSATVELGRTNMGMQQRLRQGPADVPGRAQRRPQGQPGARTTTSGIDFGDGNPDVDMLSTIEIDRDAGQRRPPPARARGQMPERHAPPSRDNNDSGIQVEHGSMAPAGMSGTVTLSRKGMGMQQRPRGERAPAAMRGGRAAPPSANVPRRTAPAQGPQARPPAQQQAATGYGGPAPDGPFSVVQDDHVSCPNCAESYEVPPEVYGAVAECPDCGFEFKILPPGSSPAIAQPAQQAALPGPRALPPAQPIDPAAMPRRQPAPAAAIPVPASAPAGPAPAAPAPSQAAPAASTESGAKKQAAAKGGADNKILIVALVVLIVIVIALVARMVLTG